MKKQSRGQPLVHVPVKHADERTIREQMYGRYIGTTCTPAGRILEHYQSSYRDRDTFTDGNAWVSEDAEGFTVSVRGGLRSRSAKNAADALALVDELIRENAQRAAYLKSQYPQLRKEATA